jgi:hypothetical protein
MAECYLCGTKLKRKVNWTNDHIPPDCFFPPGTPNMITVPCCYSCNQEYKSLDENIKNHMSRLIFNKTLEPIDRGCRAVERSPKLLKKFLSYTKVHPTLVGKDGKPRIVYYFNKAEIDKWLIRIVKGFFFHKNRSRISNNAIFKPKVHSEIMPQPSDSFPMENGLERRPYFVYGVVKDDKTPKLDCWVLIFFDKLLFSVEVEIPRY